MIEARDVVVSVPVWNLPRLFDEGVLPWDLLERIQLLRKNRNRACWLGYWIAAKEPVIAMTEREMASFFATPRTGLPGFTLNFTGYDPGISPPGEYLTCVGAAFDAVEHFGDRAWIERKFHELWLDIEEMLPQAKHALWKKPPPRDDLRRRSASRASSAPIRPDATVRGVEGLWLTGDTTRSRGVGIDKAARTGITAAEAVLGGAAAVLRRHRALLARPHWRTRRRCLRFAVRMSGEVAKVAGVGRARINRRVDEGSPSGVAQVGETINWRPCRSATIRWTALIS